MYTIATILQIIQYTTCYGPIREWVSIFVQVLWVTQYSIHVDYAPICEWESVFAKLIRVIKCTVNYGPICEWASSLMST